MDRLPAFQDDHISEQHRRSAGVGGQGSWAQGQQGSSAPLQSHYHYYPGTGSPMVSEVNSFFVCIKVLYFTQWLIV